MPKEKKIPAQELFKDYVPEILEYDPDVDGSLEHKIREDHLDAKAKLIKKVLKAKADKKDNKTTYRQPIRTENEK